MMDTQSTKHRHQIYKYVTKTQILSLTDLLNGDNSKKSKIVVSLLKYDEETHKALEVLDHYLNPLDAKYICWEILTNALTEYKDYKGSKRDGKYQARILTVKRNPDKGKGYLLVLDQGEGQPTEQGAVTMKKKECSQWICLSEQEMKKLALALLDYIRAWEIKQMMARTQEA
jgi:hypothetical protein